MWFTKKRILVIAAIAFISLLFILFGNIHFGLEFTGGTRIPITLEKSVSQSTMQDIVNIIKARTTKFGLTQVMIKSVGDKQIYVEIPESDPGFVSEIEKILKAEGKFEAIIDKRIALTGNDLIAGSIRDEPEIIGENIRWGVSFVTTQEGAKKFGDAAYGKGGYPVYLFLDRTEDSAIIIHPEDIYNENFTKEEINKAINDILSIGDNELIILTSNITDITKNKANYNLILNSNKTNFVVSENEKELINFLKENNKTVIEKKENEMKIIFGKGKTNEINIEEWPAIGLLSAPLLSENLAMGKAGQMYKIEGQAIGATYDERKEYAILQMKKIRSILSGGALPVRLILGSTTTVPPSLGKEFLNYSVIGVILVYIVVMIIVLVRYRKPKFIPPLIFCATTQILILVAILGGVGTLDLATIAGLFSSIGTSVDAQIVVSDDLFSSPILSKEDGKKRIRRSFYIITRDAAIVIVAIVPLLFSNLVEIIGFVTAMLLGTLLSIIITTQVYNSIVESLFEEKK